MSATKEKLRKALSDIDKDKPGATDTPAVSRRGGARPGSGRKSTVARSAPDSLPAGATPADWELLSFSVANLALLAGDYCAARTPGFPNTEEWRKRRAQATVMLVKKYGAGVAQYSVEFNFAMAWAMSFAMCKLPKGQFVADLSKLLPKEDITPAVVPSSPGTGPAAREGTETGDGVPGANNLVHAIAANASGEVLLEQEPKP